MKNQILLFSVLLLVMVSCKKGETVNPFATPVGCVKEYLNSRDSCDMARMLNCFSYDPKYESLLRESLQPELEKGFSKDNEYNYRTDSVVLKEEYPNSAVVTVYFTRVYTNRFYFWPGNYDINLVKESDNWKIEARLSIGIR